MRSIFERFEIFTVTKRFKISSRLRGMGQRIADTCFEKGKDIITINVLKSRGLSTGNFYMIGGSALRHEPDTVHTISFVNQEISNEVVLERIRYRKGLVEDDR